MPEQVYLYHGCKYIQIADRDRFILSQAYYQRLPFAVFYDGYKLSPGSRMRIS